jgi:hypothetical protein
MMEVTTGTGKFRRLGTLVCVVCACLAASCNREPRSVFVPENESTSTLNISAGTVRAAPGEEILLSASRKNHGAWVEVRRKGLSPDACWMVQPPDPFEEEVAGNVRWSLTPPGRGKFNLGLRGDGKRTLVISEPGSYMLTATSSVWCGEPVDSQYRIVLTISPGR